MTKEALKEYLSQQYQGYQSFLDNVFFPIFIQDEEDFDTGHETEQINTSERRALADNTGVESIKLIGSVFVEGHDLYIFDIAVANRVLLERNRVGIQRLLQQVMDTVSCAFMLFHYNDNSRWDWRFTFCRKGTTASDSTDQKRYTFLLGPGQSCRTAADNFMKLYEHRNDMAIKHIEEAFDVEALSKEFFDKYKKQYDKFVLYITGKVYEEVEKNKWKEVVRHQPHPQMYPAFGCNDKVVRDYVKRLLGRIVFLHFLQKKGWMGVEPDREWGTGDTEFMKHLYERATDEQKEDFLDAVLEPLFDKALDTDAEDKHYIFDTGVKGLKNGGRLKFPYLNGGLFERDELDEIPTKFPKEYFAELLEFLYEYNFTIDENDPSDAEVGVDPEMLGRIFENLLEDNKDKGAYYTKKEIVQYMTRESLIAYLQTGIEDSQVKAVVRQFVITHDAEVLHTGADQLCDQIDQLLREVKICDPAIGSGAYPMGLLREIFLCRGAIEGFAPERASEIKRHIIQRNIYGVDIEQGAVEIARLRFWLSLVVDEVSPQSLPNLDFKIQCGNSLYTTFRSKYVNLDTTIRNSNTYAIERKKQELVSKKNKYFSLTGDVKYQCEVEIKRLILDIVELQLCYERQSWAIKRFAEGKLFGQNEPRQMSFDEVEIARAIMPEHQALIDYLQELKIKLNETTHPLKERSQISIPFFDWEIMLSDILAQGGFDIVIGNPPYVSAPTQLDNEHLAMQRKNIVESKKYKTLNEKWDLYVPFMELGLQLLRPNGVFTMIVPYPLSNQKYGKKLRRFLCEENQLVEVVDAQGFKLFENATVENCIPLVRKGGSTAETTIAHYHSDKTITKDFTNTIGTLIRDDKTYVWNLTKEERKTNKYVGLHVLGDFCYIQVGMVLQADEKTCKGEFIKDDLISSIKDKTHPKPYLEGKDIDRYLIKRIRYLEYGTERCPARIRRPTFPELYNHTKIMANTLGQVKAIIDVKGIYTCNHKLNVIVPWFALSAVNNNSINGNLKKHSRMERGEMEKLSRLVDLFYLLGILNSSKGASLLDNIRAGDMNIYPEHIRNIPIPLASPEKQQVIADKVKEILGMKQDNPTADTSALESEIDILVEELYKT